MVTRHLDDPPIFAAWFAQVVRDQGERVAALTATARMTFLELDAVSNRLANDLVASGVTRESPIGVLLPKDLDLLVAAVAALKAGGVYVPVDPDLPLARRIDMLEEAHVVHVVADDLRADEIGSRFHRLRPPTIAQMEGCDRVPPPNVAVAPTYRAYIIFTSGSTGRPKGVAIDHRNLSQSLAARVVHYRSPPRVMSLIPSISFDSSIATMFWPLLTGGAIFMPKSVADAGVRTLLESPFEPVTDLLCVPSLYDAILDTVPASTLSSLRRVVVAGERCPRSLALKHFERVPAATLHNEYGPTEASVWATVHDVRPEDHEGVVPIGRPARHVTVTLMNDLEIVSDGRAGEIVIGGPGVGQGYVGDAELTRQRFVTLPDLGRVYRTGDVARTIPNGELEFIGRIDNQVKVNGVRLELGEIESILSSVPGVAEAAAISVKRPDDRVEIRVFARLDTGAQIDPETLRRSLAQYLPVAVVPPVTLLDSFPRTPNRKIDRDALATRADPGNEGDDPGKQTTDWLLATWQELLSSPVNLDTNLFEHGVDSLILFRFAAHAEDAGFSVRPRDLFTVETLREMAALLVAARAPT